MRIDCPVCGLRDLREFSIRGAAVVRPLPEDGDGAWQDYLYLRDNPAGRLSEHWQHAAGCGAWLVVERDTVTHEIHAVALAGDAS